MVGLTQHLPSHGRKCVSVTVCTIPQCAGLFLWTGQGLVGGHGDVGREDQTRGAPLEAHRGRVGRALTPYVFGKAHQGELFISARPLTVFSLNKRISSLANLNVVHYGCKLSLRFFFQNKSFLLEEHLTDFQFKVSNKKQPG